MQAKLFMIPWIIELVVAQRAAAQQPPPPPPTVPATAPSTQVLTNELLVDAHHRHFYEMLRRQQQINDALLLNNALLHPHIPTLLPPPPPLFNPFVAAASPTTASQGSTSKLGTYGKDEKEEEEEAEDVVERIQNPEEKEGTVEAPQRGDVVKKTLAGVKTVSIQRKGEVAEDVEKASTTTSPSFSAEDLEVVQLFKKLNLSKEEAKSIVEHVEQVVRQKLVSSTTTSSTTTTTTTTTSAPTTTSTPYTTPSTSTTTTTPTTTEAETELEREVEGDVEDVTTTAPVPQMRVRSEENLILQRNNLKHHPIKLQSTKKLPEPATSEEVFQGSIKTSLTHLPIIVANEEEDVNNPKSGTTLHKRILIASHDREKENDRDLLVDFATGAPLDLSEHETAVPTKIRPEQLAVSSTTRRPPQPPMPSSLPPRQTHHEVTNFERLATDYRRRLENTGDLNRILQKISENAYISLERGGARKLYASEARRI